ncbi:MAG TPA: TetR/AcrR family transcriptional regulator [Polyangia bacterium]|nr:TetR/AcrR family transcriptional regulator [Polyangia bacterium]
MPAAPKTSDAAIVEAARKLVERHGHGGFSMSDVARAVGVRAPSLYGRFADRAALLTAVEIETWRALERAVARVPPSANPIETLAAQARAYRSFAKAHPNAYALIHDANAERTEAGQQARLAALSPTLPAFTALAGESGALNAARTLVPFLHGFVSMELAGAFRLGGGLNEAFENGVATILAGLSSNHNPRRRG